MIEFTIPHLQISNDTMDIIVRSEESLENTFAEIFKFCDSRNIVGIDYEKDRGARHLVPCTICRKIKN